jgi:hypothetical protein
MLIYLSHILILSLHYRVKVSDGVYDLYETGYRDATAVTASIASKLVPLRNEIHPVPTATGTATATVAAAEPSRKKSKMTHRMPIDFTAALPDDCLELLYFIDNIVAII